MRVCNVIAILVAAVATTARAQQADSLPPGVTAGMVSEGAGLFKGVGLCTACHGANAKGIPNLGPDLTDAKWLHSSGSFDELVGQITTGVPADKSTSGVAMPPKGGSQLSDDQVRRVAAYVWTLSHGSK